MLLLATLTPNTAWAYDDLQLLNGYSLTAYADKSYYISSVDDWDALAAYVASGKNCQKMTFKLTTDLGTTDAPVTTMMGSDKSHRFAGTFDGNGKTLTVSLTSIETSPNYCAPFAYTNNVKINNLHVTGTITATGQFAAGLVGSSNGRGSITNCHVSIELISNYDEGNTNRYANHGGIIGISEASATITNSWFDGKFSGRNYKYSAGFIGINKGDQTSLSNCLFNPQSLGSLDTTGSCEFVHNLNNGKSTLSDCYWVTHFGEPENAQGQKVVAQLSEEISGQTNLSYYVITLDEVPDGKTYYIVKHNPTWNDVKDALEAGTDFELTGNIEAGTEDESIVIPAVTIPSGENITLTLNGTLDRALALGQAQEDGFVIKVEEGATLTIKGGTITGGNNTGNGGGIYNAGTLNIIGTTITGNFTAGHGGGIYNAGTLTIDGATITDNQGKNEDCLGIGVYVAMGSTFSVKGAVQINGNTYTYYAPEQKKTPHNVYLDGTSVISITGSMTGSAIGVEGGTDNIIASFADLEEAADESTFPGIFQNDKNAKTKAYVDGTNKQVLWNTTGKKPLTSDGITVTVSFADDETPTYTGSAIEPTTVTIKDGTSNITERCIVSYSNNVNAGTNTARVIISAKAGDSKYIGSTTVAFTIAQKPVTIAANPQTVTYGETINTEVTEETVAVEGLIEGHSLAAVTLTPSTPSEGVATVGTYTITPSAATISDGTTDVTANYDITYGDPATLTVNQKAITITANDQTIAYGEAIQQGAAYVTVTNTDGSTTTAPLVGEQTLAAITLTPSTPSEGVATVGTYTITPSAATIKDGTTDVTANYDITYADPATLTVTPAEVVVTITGKNKTEVYDGNVHIANGYTARADNKAYNVHADFTFNGYAAVWRTSVGTSKMNLRASNFVNTNDNFSSVTFVINDGYVTVYYHETSFADDADNAGSIDTVVEDYGSMATVTLANRTLYKDGHWNTLCLPFDVDLAAEDCPLAGADVRTLSGASFADGALNLQFTGEGEVTTLEAGVPYIIKWAEGTDIFEPTFKGVTLSNEVTEKTFPLGDGKSVTFKGTYAPVAYAETNKGILLVGEGSTLYYPEVGAYTNAQRAYFQLTGIEVSAVQSNAIGLRFGDATGIASPKSSPEGKDFSPLLQEGTGEAFYDLSGRRIMGQPTKAGIYIVNGKKVVVK